MRTVGRRAVRFSPFLFAEDDGLTAFLCGVDRSGRLCVLRHQRVVPPVRRDGVPQSLWSCFRDIRRRLSEPLQFLPSFPLLISVFSSSSRSKLLPPSPPFPPTAPLHPTAPSHPTVLPPPTTLQPPPPLPKSSLHPSPRPKPPSPPPGSPPRPYRLKSQRPPAKSSSEPPGRLLTRRFRPVVRALRPRWRLRLPTRRLLRPPVRALQPRWLWLRPKRRERRGRRGRS